MKQKLWILIIAFVLIGCATPSSNPVLITEADAERVEEFQMVLMRKAYEEQDTVLLDQLLHEDFQLIDDNGDRYSKQDEMTYVGSYGPSYSEFNYVVSDVKLFETGVAVVTGVGTMKGTDIGGAYITTFKSSNVLLKVEGNWQAINSHVSGVKEERFENAPE